MTRVWLGFALLTAVLWSTRPALGETPEKGFIIRDVDRAVYIDLGRRDSVRVGDLYSIVDTEVFANPLSGDTLAVSPKSVGTLRVRQVFEKMSLAEVLQLQRGRDPMMMRIQPVRDPERLAEIEEYLQSPAYTRGFRPSRRAMLIPGLQQLRSGQKGKGLTLMGMEAVSLACAIGYRVSSNDWKDQYDNLPAGLSRSEYDHYFHEADKRRTRSNRFFWLAGAVYAYHLADLLWLQDGVLIAGDRDSSAYTLAWGPQQEGPALLRLTRRF